MWHPPSIDKNGYLVFTDLELHLASARVNKTRSSVSGAARQTNSGNPWFDPGTGRFANGPAGVSVRAGGALLKNLLNSSKSYISQIAARTKADAISARPGKDGKVIVTLFLKGELITEFALPSNKTEPTQAAAQTPVNMDDKRPTNEVGSRPANVNKDEWARRMDAVRSAAREFEPQELEDVREWLKGNTNRELTDDEIKGFLADVRRQRVDDLVDILDHSIRRTEALRKRGRRQVRVVPPRGWVRRTMAHLQDDEIVELHRRLDARGFSSEELDKYLIGRFPDARKEKLQARVGKPDDKNKSKNSSRPDSQRGNPQR